ncbi:MAG: hypothetical protein ABW189_08040 [Rickettsiales bacterium]
MAFFVYVGDGNSSPRETIVYDHCFLLYGPPVEVSDSALVSGYDNVRIADKLAGNPCFREVPKPDRLALTNKNGTEGAQDELPSPRTKTREREELETFCFKEADSDHWSVAALWKAEEAAALSLGKEPSALSSDAIRNLEERIGQAGKIEAFLANLRKRLADAPEGDKQRIHSAMIKTTHQLGVTVPFEYSEWDSGMIARLEALEDYKPIVLPEETLRLIDTYRQRLDLLKRAVEAKHIQDSMPPKKFIACFQESCGALPVPTEWQKRHAVPHETTEPDGETQEAGVLRHSVILPEEKADFVRWGKTKYWSLDEAIALSLGKEPNAIREWRKLEEAREFVSDSVKALNSVPPEQKEDIYSCLQDMARQKTVSLPPKFPFGRWEEDTDAKLSALLRTFPAPLASFEDEYRFRHELATRDESHGAFASAESRLRSVSASSPAPTEYQAIAFLQWMDEREITFPPELGEQVRKFNNNAVDWKSRYLALEKKLKEIEDERNAACAEIERIKQDNANIPKQDLSSQEEDCNTSLMLGSNCYLLIEKNNFHSTFDCF